jgi:hypothetical protein
LRPAVRLAARRRVDERSTCPKTDTTHVGPVPQERVPISMVMETGVCTDPEYEYP